MANHRRSYRRTLLTAAVIAVALAAAPTAFASPALVSPSGGASVVESESVEYRWTGALEGDPDQLGRSYFRVEIAETDLIPPGTNMEWPSITNYVITAPGQATTTGTMGAPDAGAYSWRVCAWGVVDDQDITANNQLELISCSSKRSLAISVAVVPAEQAPGLVKIGDTIPTTAPTTRKTVNRPPASTPGRPSDDSPAAAPTPQLAPDFAIKGFDPVSGSAVGNADSAVGSGSTGGGAFGSIGSLGGSIMSGLTSNIPGIPIPFWTLLVLLLPIPGALWWRRSALRMFDLPVAPAPADLVFDTDGEVHDSGLQDGVKAAADSDGIADSDARYPMGDRQKVA